MVEQDIMRGPIADGDLEVCVSSERESRFARVKRILSGTLTIGRSNNNQLAKMQEEQKNDKNDVKTRKRKERQESIGSLSQERKLIRSNSEERAETQDEDKVKDNIRRVSSHEDFKKSQPEPLHEHNISAVYITKNAKNEKSFDFPNRVSPHRDPKSDFLADIECDHEKRRSSERFSRPLTPRGRKNNFGKKRKSKHFVKTQYEYISKENEISQNANKPPEETVQSGDVPDVKIDLLSDFAHLHASDRERSPSPVDISTGPSIDLPVTEQYEYSDEPVPSLSNWVVSESDLPNQLIASNRMLSSPRNSIIMTHRIYLDPDIPKTNKAIETNSKNPLEQRIKQVSKQRTSIKKKIRKYEDDFETQNGYRPSYADKMGDVVVKKMYVDLNKLKKESKQLKEDPMSAMLCCITKQSVNVSAESTGGSRAFQIKETLVEVERRLKEKRHSSNRPDVLEEMSGDQLIDEKLAVQKALLYIESLYGRPVSKEDRDLVRPLYDRYRNLKRLVARSGVAKINSSSSELGTIHEDETMNFVSQPSLGETEPEKANTVSGSTDSDTDTSLGENLNSMSLTELMEQQRIVNEEKKQLRRTLKEFENTFEVRTGKKFQKDDRLPMEATYVSYKKIKAKLRLLEALLTKRMQ